ncbi:response regulator transcription factor [Microlunatus aurantiacus]|uniref:response regulator transcription factor n=1 Tax=Microlunatus aurantiacus TaxID=446786 RepID=UPI0031DFD974
MIAEDQVLLRDGLVRLLTGAGHAVVAQVGDGRRLVAEVSDRRPDLVIADVRMPPTYTDEGAAAVLFLRERYPELAVVILSQVVEPSLVAALTGGRVRAFGYLLKDRVLDTRVFLDQLATVVDGGTAIDPVVVENYVQHSRDRLHGLTGREVEVLGLVASGRSNTGIAAELVISRRTVDAHLRSIFTKLGIESDPEDNQRVLAALDWLASRGRVAG